MLQIYVMDRMSECDSLYSSTLPGFMIPLGSMSALIFFIRSTCTPLFE